MTSPGPVPSLRRRALGLVAACAAVGATTAWRAEAADRADAAGEAQQTVAAVTVAVRLGAGIDGVWVVDQSERFGWAAPGSAAAAHAALAERLRAMPGSDHPCIAPAVAVPDIDTAPEDRLMDLYQSGWSVMQFCGDDQASDPDLAQVVRVLPVFDDAGFVWSVVVDARIAAGVDTIADDLMTDFDAYAGVTGADPRFGLPPEVHQLADAISLGLDPADRELLAGVGRGPATAPYQQELDWLDTPEGWRTPRPHPERAELARARAALMGEVEDRLLALLAPIAADAATDAASTRRSVAFATGAVVAAALAAVLALGAVVLAAAGRIRHLRSSAERDSLTGVANRAGARARADAWFADPSTPLAVAVVDLDHFKRFNDELGHAAGDQVLVRTAARLVEHVVGATTVVCRWGGDEFVVVFRLDHQVTDLDSVLARLHQAITQPIDIEGTLVAVGATIGAATCACGECGFDDLFRAADRRLYEVKTNGRNHHATGGCLTGAAVTA